MNNREKIVLSRGVFITVMILALALIAAFNSVFNKGANFEAGMEKPAEEQIISPEEPLHGVTEPEDSYQLIKLTFGGTCTPASILGSTVYGTFNSMKNEKGTDYFLSRISNIFNEDDLTLVGCNAVITDKTDLTPSTDTSEWYLTSANSIDIFKNSGVDAISLECPRNMDYGWVGFAALKETVRDSGLMWGDSGKAIYQSFGDIDVGIYCCILRESDRNGIIGWIEGAVQKNDFVVLYVTDTDTGAESPSDDKIALLQAYVDAGADLIVASNGKNLQYAEAYGDGYIVYSLGALIDGTSIYPERFTSLLSVELKAKDGEIIDVAHNFIPLRTYDDEHSWQPSVLEDGAEKYAILASINK